MNTGVALYFSGTKSCTFQGNEKYSKKPGPKILINYNRQLGGFQPNWTTLARILQIL